MRAMPRAFFFEALSHREMDWILLLAKTSVIQKTAFINQPLRHVSYTPRTSLVQGQRVQLIQKETASHSRSNSCLCLFLSTGVGNYHGQGLPGIINKIMYSK